MVWREFQQQAINAGHSLNAYRDPLELKEQEPDFYEVLANKVFEFWGAPSQDPCTPPPHSTGAAVDLTLENDTGQEIDMGSPIDETTERSYPDHYADAASPERRNIHTHRVLLNEVMSATGFKRHRNEWWHFSLGDQMWAWATGQPTARYGRVENSNE